MKLIWRTMRFCRKFYQFLKEMNFVFSKKVLRIKILSIHSFFPIGDLKSTQIHKDFRLIACMNPGHDIGKKELPFNIRSKFTEIFVHDISNRGDLKVWKKCKAWNRKIFLLNRWLLRGNWEHSMNRRPQKKLWASIWKWRI